MDNNVVFDSNKIPFRILFMQRMGKPFIMPAPHYHDNYEIYYLFQGERYYFIKNQTYCIKKGDLILLNKYDIHHTTNGICANHIKIAVDFCDSYLQDILTALEDINLLACFESPIKVFRLDMKQQLQIEELFFKMIEEDKAKQPGQEAALKLHLCELLLYINRCVTNTNAPPSNHSNTLHAKVSDLVDYINRYYHENITLTSTSERFYISHNYMSKIFKDVTGFTFTQYLNHIRIQESIRLMIQTNYSILRIAQDVGYSSSTHFGRVFKEMIGYSPLQYRNSVKKMDRDPEMM